MDKINSIIILISIVVALIGTIVVIIDYHRQWKLIEKEVKDQKKYE